MKSPTKKVHGRPPSDPMLGSTKSLKAEVDSIGAVETRSPLELGAGQVDEFES